MKNREKYENKNLRDARANELRIAGFIVRKSCIGPCLLHPMYIEDLRHTEQAQDVSFGNDTYKTYFERVYIVEYMKLQEVA